MAFCTKCGAKLPENAAFCTECGAKVENISGVSGTPATPAKKKSKTGLIVGIVLGVLVAAAIGVFGVLFSGKYGKNAEPEFNADMPISESDCGYFFNGDWYGWWVISSGWGDYEELTGSYWDACARIYNLRDGTGIMEIWDEDNGEDDCLAQLEVGFNEDYLYSVSGGFFEPNNLDESTWVISPKGDAGTGGFLNLICISGTYQSSTEEDSGFSYQIFLRPWGMEWEDIRNGDTENCYYEDMMPFRYDSWYLPKIQAGVTSAPDSFQIDSAS